MTINYGPVRTRLMELLAQREELDVEITVLRRYLVGPKKDKEALVTAEQLKQIYHYDPETGIFTWKGGHRRGQRAGGIQKNGYRAIGIKAKRYYEHRLAWLYMTGEWPIFLIDHKNQDRLDNSFANLSEVNWRQNNTYKGLPARNTSGIKNVSYNKPTKRWRARMSHHGRELYIGSYQTKEEAAAALTQRIEYGHFDPNYCLPSRLHLQESFKQ